MQIRMQIQDASNLDKDKQLRNRRITFWNQYEIVQYWDSGRLKFERE